MHFIPCLIIPHSTLPNNSTSFPSIYLVSIGILRIFIELLSMVGTLSKASNKVLSLYQAALSSIIGFLILNPERPSTPVQNIFSESNPHYFLRKGYS